MDDENSSPATPASMKRIIALIGACNDTISELTSTQRELLERLGIDDDHLWLTMLQIALGIDDRSNRSANAAPADKEERGGDGRSTT